MQIILFAAGNDLSIDSRLLTHHEDSGLYVFVVTSASSLRERFLYLFSGMSTLDGDQYMITVFDTCWNSAVQRISCA